MLKLDRVFAKRGNVVALEDVSLSLSPGNTLAVVGESGAGKSTLIATILGLLRPTMGTITWNGRDVANCRPSLVMQEDRKSVV